MKTYKKTHRYIPKKRAWTIQLREDWLKYDVWHQPPTWKIVKDYRIKFARWDGAEWEFHDL